MSWHDDPRLPFVFTALLGMVAGVAAKQAVSISSGVYPKPVSIFADFLVLGMVFLIVMYIHSIDPKMPPEGIALLSAALAMWGPRGIAALLERFKSGALGAAQTMAKQMLVPVDPVNPPTVSAARIEEHEMAKDSTIESENLFAKTAPTRRLRDVIPLQETLPADFVAKLAEADQAAPDYGEEQSDDKAEPNPPKKGK